MSIEIVEIAVQGPPGPPGRDGITPTYTSAVALSGHLATTLNSLLEALPADCTVAGHANAVVGITLGASTAGAPAAVTSTGPLSHAGWTFLAGKPVLLGAGGAIVQSLPATAKFSQPLGVALSATQILLAIQPAIFLN